MRLTKRTTPTMPKLPTGTVAFLMTDIEGSTRLWESHGEVMGKAVARHFALLRQAISRHKGTVVKSVGDGVHAVFQTAPEALAAAFSGQRALQEERWPSGMRIRVRMALHAGVAELRDRDYYGQTMNRAARLLELGNGGQIL